MNVKEVLGAFLLVNNPIVLSEEETKDVQKAIKQLQQENKILKENAENNDKVVDKVNWENMLLKKENQELKKQLEEYKNPIKYFKYANKNVTEENKQLKDNWNKLKEYLENKIDEYSINLEYLSAERMTQIKNKIQELKRK